MATRKIPPGDVANNDSGDATKRRRVIGLPAEFIPASLGDLNDNCLVSCLSFLHFEDLNSLAICSQRSREIRSHESLDQTRSATILCPGGREHNPAIVLFLSGRAQLFSGHRTHLRIAGIANAVHHDSSLNRPQLVRGVTSLDISCSPLDQNRVVKICSFFGLLRMLPNLEALNGNNLVAGDGFSFSCPCPALQRVVWKGGDCALDLLGIAFHGCSSVKELYVDDSRFKILSSNLASLPEGARFCHEVARTLRAPTHDDANVHIWMYCKAIERVSMKNATWSAYSGCNQEVFPVTQGILIKFVRCAPTLRWIRSDLTTENVSMLQRERPEVTFVSD